MGDGDAAVGVGAPGSSGPAPARRPGPGLALSIVVMVVGGVALALCGVQGARRVGRSVETSEAYSTPTDVQLHLAAGRYLVYQRTGSRSGGFGVTVTHSDAVTIHPADVSVTSASGAPVVVRAPGSITETVTHGSTIYTGAARFDVASSGDYRIRVDASRGGEVVVGQSVTQAFRGALGWFAAAAAGFVVLAAGTALLLVGIVRRSRAARTAVAATAPAPGWYPDPWQPGRLRYWDGTTWTSYQR